MAGLSGQIGWPLLRARSAILTAQFATACCYAIQYSLMGQDTGASVCLIGASQAPIAIAAGERLWLRNLGLGFIPLAIILAHFTWCGAPTLLATCASCLVMLARMQDSMMRMRAIMLCASVFGAAYDLSVGALPALTGAILSFSVGAIALRREWRAQSRKGGSTPITQVCPAQ